MSFVERNSGAENVIILLRYTDPSGGTGTVPRIVNPYHVFQLNQNATREEIKVAFKRAANQNHRQGRVMASLSYHILMSKDQRRYRRISDGYFEVTGKTDVIVLAVVGDTARLLAQISKNSSLVSCTDEHNHSLLYLTARAGFYDTTEALLQRGIPTNAETVDKSTALHAASYYEQRVIVELLLRYGTDPTVDNKWENTPADEAPSMDLTRVSLTYKKDRLSEIASLLIGKGLACSVHFIKRNGTVIGREIVRSRNAFDQQTRRTLDSLCSRWRSVWHGTKVEHLESIMRHGLKPSGSKLPDGYIISPPLNHFQLDKEYFGNSNWARAIFVSPSITYASHVVYSDRIWSENQQWCTLIRAYVKPDTYDRHKATVFRDDPTADEPALPEYRISREDEEFFRLKSGAGSETVDEFDRNVVVTSTVFISLNFLEKTPNLGLEVFS